MLPYWLSVTLTIFSPIMGFVAGFIWGRVYQVKYQIKADKQRMLDMIDQRQAYEHAERPYYYY